MEQSHEYKTCKYKIFKKEPEKEGYSVIVKAVEIGTTGFVVGTLYQFQGQIKIKGRNKAICIKYPIEIMEKCSMQICNKRNIQGII